MVKIALTGGDYRSRDIIASSQRVVNLYPEAMNPDQGEPSAFTYNQTPGLVLLGTAPNNDPIRCLYRASNGDLYCVAGLNVYYISSNWSFNLLGSFVSNSKNPVVMADNGTSLIMCDGTTAGFKSVLKTRTGFAPITDSGWLGSSFVDFSDTFFIANFIGTPSFYISASEDVTFDPLDFAGKSAKPDSLVAAVVSHRVIWLIGTTATEIFYNTGGGSSIANTFPFEIMPGISIDDGCCATYSIAKNDTMVFWLAQSSTGTRYLLQGSGYKTSRVSNHAIENVWSKYKTVSDAIAYAYSQNGHNFYVINFPTADTTWVYDINLKLWHQRVWINNDGVEHRHRASYHAFAYDKNIVGDWENGNIYSYDLNVYTDNGLPVKRLRSFPQMIDGDDNNRQIYKSFTADMSVGNDDDSADNPIVSLRWSDTKGASWSNPVEQSLGKRGQYLTNINWNRLGMAHNRVFELSWSSNCQASLNGAFIEIVKCGS